jgi:hypothetical protein
VPSAGVTRGSQPEPRYLIESPSCASSLNPLLNGDPAFQVLVVRQAMVVEPADARG